MYYQRAYIYDVGLFVCLLRDCKEDSLCFMYPYTEKIINSLLTNVVFDMAKYMFGYF